MRDGRGGPEAHEAGARLVGSDDLAAQVEAGKFYDFDVGIATPNMMRFIGPLRAYLGARGMMPTRRRS